MKPVHRHSRAVGSQAGGFILRGSVLIIKKKLIVSIIMVFSLAGCQVQTDPRDIRPGGPGPDPDSPLIGTRWLFGDWGEQIVYFETAETVEFNGNSYTYTYNKETRNGHADYLSRFTVAENYENMTFHNWRQYGHPAHFTRVR